MMLDPRSTASHSTQMIPVFLPFRGPFSRWPRLSEAILVACVFFTSLLIPRGYGHQGNGIVLRTFTDIPVVVVALLVIAAVALFWRRSHPIGVLVTTLVLIGLSTALGYSFDFFGVPVVMYSVGRYEVNDRLSQLGGAAIAIIGLIMLFDSIDTLSDIGAAFVILFISWYVGRRIRARGEYLRLLQERAIQLEKEKKYESQRAVAAERVRIARELHDVVAHQVSMMTVQAAAARIMTFSNPNKAVQAMDAVETAGRNALVELRYLLGVLRPDDENGELKPQPNLKDMQQLFDRFRKAGLSVSFTENSTQQNISTGIELTIYRIIQEALTNVLKHGGNNVSAFVSLAIDQKGVNIEINNDGSEKVKKSHKDASVESGYGIVGMRERVTLLGGTFQAVPGEQGGYKVTCHIPIK